MEKSCRHQGNGRAELSVELSSLYTVQDWQLIMSSGMPATSTKQETLLRPKWHRQRKIKLLEEQVKYQAHEKTVQHNHNGSNHGLQMKINSEKKVDIQRNPDSHPPLVDRTKRHHFQFCRMSFFKINEIVEEMPLMSEVFLYREATGEDLVAVSFCSLT